MRYAVLLILVMPIIVLALVNIITQYKLQKISKGRFVRQLVMWVVILCLLVSSFPIYNVLIGNEIFSSNELSVFDIVQTTALVYFLYILNRQRQKIENVEKNLYDMHQELAIKLSKNGKS